MRRIVRLFLFFIFTPHEMKFNLYSYFQAAKIQINFPGLIIVDLICNTKFPLKCYKITR